MEEKGKIFSNEIMLVRMNLKMLGAPLIRKTAPLKYIRKRHNTVINLWRFYHAKQSFSEHL